jgi:hypothetical protein
MRWARRPAWATLSRSRWTSLRTRGSESRSRSSKHTKPSLPAARAAIGPQKVGALINKVGDEVKHLFDSMPAHSTADLVKVAHGTFWPVNAAMFGETTISESRCPVADSWFHAFDEYIPQVTGGLPATMFDEMQEAAANMVDRFQRSIGAGNLQNTQQCPELHERFLPSRTTSSRRTDKVKGAVHAQPLLSPAGQHPAHD